MWTTAGPARFLLCARWKEDLKRRDFTINALALDENGQVIDLFQGLDDLENRICGQLELLQSALMKMLSVSCGAFVFRPPWILTWSKILL